jgi:hypothetical protein
MSTGSTSDESAHSPRGSPIDTPPGEASGSRSPLRRTRMAFPRARRPRHLCRLALRSARPTRTTPTPATAAPVLRSLRGGDASEQRLDCRAHFPLDHVPDHRQQALAPRHRVPLPAADTRMPDHQQRQSPCRQRRRRPRRRGRPAGMNCAWRRALSRPERGSRGSARVILNPARLPGPRAAQLSGRRREGRTRLTDSGSSRSWSAVESMRSAKTIVTTFRATASVAGRPTSEVPQASQNLRPPGSSSRSPGRRRHSRAALRTRRRSAPRRDSRRRTRGRSWPNLRSRGVAIELSRQRGCASGRAHCFEASPRFGPREVGTICLTSFDHTLMLPRCRRACGRSRSTSPPTCSKRPSG